MTATRPAKILLAVLALLMALSVACPPWKGDGYYPFWDPPGSRATVDVTRLVLQLLLIALLGGLGLAVLLRASPRASKTHPTSPPPSKATRNSLSRRRFLLLTLGAAALFVAGFGAGKLIKVDQSGLRFDRDLIVRLWSGSERAIPQPESQPRNFPAGSDIEKLKALPREEQKAELKRLHSEGVLTTTDVRVIVDSLKATQAETLSQETKLPRHINLGRRLYTQRHREQWGQHLVAINQDYQNLTLAPLPGLIPVGKDEDSGLWEFWYTGLGGEPLRDEFGRLSFSDDPSLLLVLIPGGTFVMGAQSEDASGLNYDPAATEPEGPVHEVQLRPFFMAKYEMTYGQWVDLTGEEGLAAERGASTSKKGEVRSDVYGRLSLSHPVNSLSWRKCVAALRPAGLAMPTAAQWEFAARAGSTSPYWCDSEARKLVEFANIKDRFALSYGAPPVAPGVDSGFDEWFAEIAVKTMPVGSLKPNGFGLHDVHGNVWEWCLDGGDRSFYQKSPWAEPVAESKGARTREIRGGAFDSSAAEVRSSFRAFIEPEGSSNVGIRPVMAVP